MAPNPKPWPGRGEVRFHLFDADQKHDPHGLRIAKDLLWTLRCMRCHARTWSVCVWVVCDAWGIIHTNCGRSNLTISLLTWWNLPMKEERSWIIDNHWRVVWIINREGETVMNFSKHRRFYNELRVFEMEASRRKVGRTEGWHKHDLDMILIDENFARGVCKRNRKSYN